jgi:SPX domain protein involved in polyphosphate accumulation
MSMADKVSMESLTEADRIIKNEILWEAQQNGINSEIYKEYRERLIYSDMNGIKPPTKEQFLVEKVKERKDKIYQQGLTKTITKAVVESLRANNIEVRQASETGNPPTAAETDIPSLTDAECFQRLDSTGFIKINLRIKDRTVYLVEKPHTVLDVFDELAKMTGSESRARAIMFQNMSGVKSTMDRYRPKKSLKN